MPLLLDAKHVEYKKSVCFDFWCLLRKDELAEQRTVWNSTAETYKINKATCEIVSFRNFSSLSVSPFFDKFFTEYTMFQDADWSDEVIFHDIWTLKKYPIMSLPEFIDVHSSSSMTEQSSVLVSFFKNIGILIYSLSNSLL